MQNHSDNNTSGLNRSRIDYQRRSSCGSLPASFTPNSYTVISGRGQILYKSIGNRRFRQIVKMHLQRYSETKEKHAKSLIVTEVIDMIHSAGGQFVKQVGHNKAQTMREDGSASDGSPSPSVLAALSSGRWELVSTAAMREKVSSAFRDLLHTKYTSAAKNKNSRRLAKVKQQRQEQGDKLYSELTDVSTKAMDEETKKTQATVDMGAAPAASAPTSLWQACNASSYADHAFEESLEGLLGSDNDEVDYESLRFDDFPLP